MEQWELDVISGAAAAIGFTARLDEDGALCIENECSGWVYNSYDPEDTRKALNDIISYGLED